MKKSFFIFVVVAVFVVEAWWVRERLGGSEGRHLVPDSIAGSLEEFQITSTDATVSVRKIDGRWVVASLSDYPAAENTVLGFLQALNDASVVAKPSTGDVDVFKDAVEVRLTAADHRMVLRLGAMSEGAVPGRFVQVDDGPVVLCDTFFDGYSADPLAWIERRLAPGLDPDRVVRVTVLSTRAEFTMSVADDGYRLSGDLETPSVNRNKGRQWLDALSRVEVSGIVPPDVSDEAAGIAGPELVTVTTDDGRMREFLIGEPLTNQTRSVRIRGDGRPEEAWRYVISEAAVNAILPYEKDLRR